MSTQINRREALGRALGALATAPLVDSTLSAAIGAVPKRQPFKLAINVEPPKLDPAEIAPGWDTTEIPLSRVIKPFSTEEKWKQVKTQIKSWKLPPITSSSHFAEDILTPGESRIYEDC